MTDEGGAAEEIFLQGEAVKAPAIGGGIDTREIGLFGKETELGEGAGRGLLGRFGHLLARTVSQTHGGRQQDRPQDQRLRERVRANRREGKVSSDTLLEIVYQGLLQI